MTATPPDVPGETDEPNVRLALLVALLLIEDLGEYVDHPNGDRADLLLRVGAVAGVLRRLRERMEAQDGGE